MCNAMRWLYLVSVLGVGVLCGCSRGETTLPGQVLGLWKTSEPRYASRFLKLESRNLTVGMGGGRQATYQITRVERAQGLGRFFARGPRRS